MLAPVGFTLTIWWVRNQWVHFIYKEPCLHITLCSSGPHFLWWLCCAGLSRSVMSDSATPWTAARQVPLSMGTLQARILGGLPGSPSGDLPNLGIKPRSPALQVDSLLSKPPGKPKNTGMGSLSLLQQIFPTQGSNQGLLHCRQILYHWATREAHLWWLIFFNWGKIYIT